MVFGRAKKARNRDEAVNDAAAAVDEQAEPAVEEDTGAYNRSKHGPLDVDEISSKEGYVDLGSLLVAPHEGLQLRLEVEEATQRVVAVTLDLEGSSLQLQGFAAPRSEGLWEEIREQIGQSVAAQGGVVEELEGTFGPEVLAKLPAETADGSRGYRVARFIGVDGPRWFLRGVLGGPAALDRDAAQDLETLFRAVVVVRGESPMPPRDLLPLTLPRDAVSDPTGHVPADRPAEGQPTEPFRRGPEITHIG